MIPLAAIIEWKLGQVYFDARCRTDEVNGAMVITQWDTAGRAKPTAREIKTWTAEWQADQDATDYRRKREDEYPPVDELLVALWEREVEARPEAADALQVKRAAVKAKYPMPSER